MIDIKEKPKSEKPSLENINISQKPKQETEDEIKFIDGDLQKVSVRPGDVIVLSCPMILSERASNRMIEHFRGIFPNNKSVILEEGIKLGVAENGKGKISELLDKIEANLGHYSEIGGPDCPYIKTDDKAIRESVEQIRVELK